MTTAKGAVVVDASALQSPTSRGRGIGRYAREWALALEAANPELVVAYLLDPDLPPPGDLGSLVGTGKVAYRTADALPGSVRVLHSLSPLDLAVGLDTLWPPEAAVRGLRRSATVYDLIPAKDEATYLADPVGRLRYRTRLEALRVADQLHAISLGVRSDLGAVLRVPVSRIVVTGAAPAAHFRPRSAGADATLTPDHVGAALDDLGVRRPFVLYPTGSHPRKNNERLLAAWSELPGGLRQELQLVLTGDLPAPTANHLRHLAGLGGFENGLLVTGDVADDVLVRLYQDALLVCFPSLAEGYGLPVAEALACGTPVIAADMAPLDELVGPKARFDPSDPKAIAAALRAAIDDDDHRACLARGVGSLTTWSEVGERTCDALEALAALPRRRGRPTSGRPRIAFVSPWPPAETGVAAYSARLVDALARVGPFRVDCFADGPTPGQVAPTGADALHGADALIQADQLKGHYDEVVYALGNSHHHLGALAGLRRRTGVVVAHDVRLTNLYRHEAGQPRRRPDDLARTIRALYGDAVPSDLGATAGAAVDEMDRYGLVMAREAITASRLFLVSSAEAAALARLDARPADAAKITCLPFAFATAAGDLPAFGDVDALVAKGASWDGSRGEGTRWSARGPLVAHFGIVDPSKDPFLLVDAFALAATQVPGSRLAFVGPISDALGDDLRKRAEALGVADALIVTGRVPPYAYAQALASAAVAVQLRATTNGEASAAVGDCLAAGRATIVSDVGWARELPSDAVVLVDRWIDAPSLAAVLVGLLADGRRRDALGRAGREEAARRSFEATAKALVSLLGG